MTWPHDNGMPYNMPLKVHINPNFRGKPISSRVQGNGERPVGIHFNPHWKPNSEGLDTMIKNGIANAIRDSTNPSLPSNLRRTIHINPKVIPKGVSQSISTLLLQEHMSSNTVSMPVGAYEGQEEQKPIVYQSSSKVNSSAVSFSNQKVCEVNSITKVKKTIDSPTLLNKFRKNMNVAKSPVIRSAKVVRSKYKYLNSSVTSQLLPQHLVKSRNCPSTFGSRFRYIKQSEDLRPIQKSGLSPKNHAVSRFKFVKGTSASKVEVKPGTTLTPRRIRAQKILENVKNIPEHTMKSRYKLTRGTRTAPKQISGFKDRPLTSAQKLKTPSRYKYVRTAQTQRSPLKRKSPRSLKSRFKIIRGPETQPARKTRYRLIRNHQETPIYKSRVYQPLPFFGRRNRWANSILHLQATKIVTSNKKLLRIGRKPENISNRKDKIRKAKLLNIGGVFYRSTRTTLTRSAEPAAASSKGEKKNYPVKGQVLSIRGSKFVLDKTGKTLQRLTPNKIPISRIHIGGVTFVPSTENTLVRSRVHEARYLVSQAKQKSIAVLTSKLRKNNQPCLMYQRLGKCRLHDNGRCPKVHDPRKIAICNDFVNGKCLKSAAECRLSHDVGPEKMPTCHFFLEGCCVRDPCPFSHVKLNQKAAVCRDFLSGYCSAGEKCKKRHVFLCPEFEETRRCSKGKYCTYRHADEVRARTAHSLSDVSAAKQPEGPTTFSKQTADSLIRYYLKKDAASLTDKKDGGCHLGVKPEGCVTNEEPVVLLPERSKLGDLPGFIPF